jgi:hypothetical protein
VEQLIISYLATIKMTLEEFQKIREGQAAIAKPAVEPQLTNIQVKLLKDINVRGEESVKAGTIVKVWVPIGTVNPKTVQVIPAGAGGRRITLVVGKDVELINKDETAPQTAPEKASGSTNKPNWVLIGGIVLVGYFLLKK